MPSLQTSLSSASSPNSRMPNVIHGKNVITVNNRILNLQSDFAPKQLCDGITFSAGSSCVFSCRYCYVETMMNRGGSAVALALKQNQKKFHDVVLRRQDAVQKLKVELASIRQAKRCKDQVVYTSPAVDIAATMELVTETAELTSIILKETAWQVRLLSKSPLIYEVAKKISQEFKGRVIYGLSTGTFDDRVAKAIEPDAPLPSKRLETLRELQKSGYRTFAMLCPILPQDMATFISAATDQIDFDRCEHIWAEVLNQRGQCMEKTAVALHEAKLLDWEARLRSVFGKGSAKRWEGYARSTFSALTAIVPPTKLSFLQYVTENSASWWQGNSMFGAIPLGAASKPAASPSSSPNPLIGHSETLDGKSETNSRLPLSPAQKAWVTMRQKYTPGQLKERFQTAARKAIETRMKNQM